jgi:hypothetical protein
MEKTIRLVGAVIMALALPVWASPTLNGWDTSQIYVIRTSIYSNGSIEVIGWRNWDAASPPTTPVSLPSVDTDGDEDADQADFGFLQICLSGDGTLYPEDLDCGVVDFDRDRDVDADDLDAFVACVGGAGVPPGC